MDGDFVHLPPTSLYQPPELVLPQNEQWGRHQLSNIHQHNGLHQNSAARAFHTVHSGSLFYDYQNQANRPSVPLGGPSAFAHHRATSLGADEFHLPLPHKGAMATAPVARTHTVPTGFPAGVGVTDRPQVGTSVLAPANGNSRRANTETAALEESIRILPKGEGSSHHGHWSTSGVRPMAPENHPLDGSYPTLPGVSINGVLTIDSAPKDDVQGWAGAGNSASSMIAVLEPVQAAVGSGGGTTKPLSKGYDQESVRSWLMNYCKKWRGVPGQKPAPRDTWPHIMWTWIGSFVSIAIIAVINQEVSPQIDLPTLVASFGASAVLLFGAPDAKLSQPRNFIGGHILSAITGVIVRNIIPDKLVWLSASIGMATALFVMQLTQTTHPPGGATALIASSVPVLGAWHGFKFIVTICFDLACMLTVALIVNNISSDRRYPMFWY